ncbi:MAG: biotin--[acetyl-CoA-carboxylase] ligase [Candidatus Heimdallarchaeota archaeon]|nr:biotin--[acetyl-CoA-carboxylase] ligase [Candidatus Heimdallarchaeota archaeon]
MDVVLDHISENQDTPLLILAEKQTIGRGRDDSTWCSPKGGFYGTYVFVIDELLEPKKMRFIHYAVALSILKTLKEFCGIDVEIKWPNDIYLENQKIGGILLEILTKSRNHLLIGIGLNVNSSKEDLADVKEIKATSLFEALNLELNLNELRQKLSENLFHYLEEVMFDQISNLVSDYNTNLLNHSKKHIFNSKTYKCKGIGNDGLLILYNENEELTVTIEESKEISFVH